MTSFDIRAELLALASSPSGIEIKNVINFSKEHTSKFEKQLDSKSFFSCLPPTSYSLDLEDLLLENSNTILTIPDGIDLLKNYIKNFSLLSSPAKTKLLTLLVSSFNNHLRFLQTSSRPHDSVESLNAYIFLIHALIQIIHQNGLMDCTKPKKGQLSGASFDWTIQKDFILETIDFLLTINEPPFLRKIWHSQNELEAIFGIILADLHLFFESQESISILKAKIIQVTGSVCKAAIQYQLQSAQDALKGSIIQIMKMQEGLAPFFADLVCQISLNFGCPVLFEVIFRELGKTTINTSESDLARSISCFLVTLSENAPKLFLKNLSYIVDFISQEPYLLRNAMLESIGYIITNYLLVPGENTQDNSSLTHHTHNLFKILEERFRDSNSFVRSKVLAICSRLCQARGIPLLRRSNLVSLAIDRILDKSSIVRRRAIHLLSDLLTFHPFSLDGGSLDIAILKENLAQANEEINKTAPEEFSKSNLLPMLSETDIENIPEIEEIEAKLIPDTITNPQLSGLLMKRKYYSDAIHFVSQLTAALPLLSQLLSSKIKSEVIEIIDFLVIASLYKIEAAKYSLDKSLYLIWIKETSNTISITAEEDDLPAAKFSIKEALLRAFKKVYLEVIDTKLSHTDKINQMTYNLLSMLASGSSKSTDSSLARLLSLKQLFIEWQEKKMLHPDVVKYLWNLFAKCSKEPLHTQRAISILLSALSVGNNISIEKQEMELSVLKGHLQSFGGRDPIICKSILILLRNYNLGDLQNESRDTWSMILFGVILGGFALNTWLEVINDCLSLIYSKFSEPQILIQQFVDGLAGEIFLDVEVKATLLANFLHLLGHASIMQANYWDSIEANMKEKVQNNYSGSSNSQNYSTDDEALENIQNLKNNELLFSKSSFISRYVPHVLDVCEYPQKYKCQAVERNAALCLVKFMSVSSRFCENYLGLFLGLLTSSSSPIIRGNLVIGFGDLITAHPNLLDQNIHFLFERLQDRDEVVRKNAFMVLMHLTLNGLVKVKGQISDMAKCLLPSKQSEISAVNSPASRIPELAKLFFTELSEKDANFIYNYLPDIISNLSTDPTVTEYEFQQIMSFIFDFVKKEKQVENLVEKLCGRFRMATSSRQYVDLAYCLSILSFNSTSSVKKLIEALPFYYDKLYDDRVFSYIAEILKKIKKNMFLLTTSKVLPSPETKMLIEDFEKKLLLIHLQENNSHQVIDSIQTASKKNIVGTKEIKRTIREIRKLKIDDENILDDLLEENDDGEPHGIYKATSTTSTKSSRPTRKAAENFQIKYISDSAE